MTASETSGARDPVSAPEKGAAGGGLNLYGAALAVYDAWKHNMDRSHIAARMQKMLDALNATCATEALKRVPAGGAMSSQRERAEARARDAAERFAAEVCDEYAKKGVDVTGVHAQVAMEAARRAFLSEHRAALEEAAALCESLARDDCSAAYAGRRIRALAAECGEEGRDG